MSFDWANHQLGRKPIKKPEAEELPDPYSCSRRMERVKKESKMCLWKCSQCEMVESGTMVFTVEIKTRGRFKKYSEGRS